VQPGLGNVPRVHSPPGAEPSASSTIPHPSLGVEQPDAQQAGTGESADRSRRAVVFRSYLLVSTVFGLIGAVLDAAALWLMGIPLPILWGLLSFITNYIPNIGFVLGLIAPALLLPFAI